MAFPQHESIIIVASGPSAKGFIPPVGIPVIAVNGAIDWVYRAHYWFSLDPSQINLKRMHHPRIGVKYYCAAPLSIDLPNHVTRLGRLPGTGFLSSNERLCDSPGAVHTGNSTWGALGLAKHMGAKRVLIIGLDASKEERCEGGFSKDLHHLPTLFESGLNQGIDFRTITNINPKIPSMNIEDGLTWITS